MIGFDPFLKSVKHETIDRRSDDDRHGREPSQRKLLPYFVGDGENHTFHINRFSPTSSLYASNRDLMSQFANLAESCETLETIEVKTQRLDDIDAVEACDLLKIDVQGGDYAVIAHGQRVLEGTLFVHIEAEFAPIYVDQPLFSDIDALLRKRGFELIDFLDFGWNNYQAMPSSVMRSRLLWADCLYMRGVDLIAARDPRLLLRAAYIAHLNYRKYDLAAHLLLAHDTRTDSVLLQTYRNAFQELGESLRRESS